MTAVENAYPTKRLRERGAQMYGYVELRWNAEAKEGNRSTIT
jgi:hypothetical protein